MKRKVRVYAQGGVLPEEIAMAAQGEQQMAPEGMPPQGGQQGGGMDPQMEALLQQVQSMVQQGAPPNVVIGGLLQNGIPPEIIMQIIMQVGLVQDEQQASEMIQQEMANMQQAQQQSPEEEQMEGASSNPQEEMMEAPQQGQPPMLLGGETQLNEQIAVYAELVGKDVREVEQMVTDMIEQNGDADAVAEQLDQAIMQIQEQQTQPQNPPQGMEQGVPEQQQQPSPMMGGQESSVMRYGGPTPQDFKEIGSQMMKKYKNGGKTEGFDKSNTESYIENLKGAISNWVTTNNKLGLIKKRTEDNLALFDEIPENNMPLPKAVNGIEIEGTGGKKTYKNINDLNKDWDDKVISDQQYLDAIARQNKDNTLLDVAAPSKKIETDGTSTSGGSGTSTGGGSNSTSPMQGESYAQWATRNKQPYGGQYSDKIWNGTQWSGSSTSDGSGTQHYFPGQESEYARSLNGSRYRSASPFGRGITDMAGEIRNRNYQSFIQGIGALSGSTPEEIQARVKEIMSDPSKVEGKIAFEDIHKKGMFGREKKRIIGQRILWNPATGKAETVTDKTDTKVDGTTDNPQANNSQVNDAAGKASTPTINEGQLYKDLQSEDKWTRKAAEDYFKNKEANAKAGTPDGTGYGNTVANNEKLQEKALLNLGSNATKEAIYDEMDRLEAEGIDAPYVKPANTVTPVTGDLNRAYSITDPATGEVSFSGSPTMTNPDYFKPGNSAWYGKNFDNYSMDSNDEMDPDTTGFNYDGEVNTYDPANEEYIKANPGAYDIKGRPELQFYGENQQGIRNYYNTKTKKYEQFNPSGSTGYDPEKGFYAQGGELKGEIIWDVQNKRFKKMPAFFALNGLETSLDSMLKKDASKINYTEGFDAVQQKSGLNWDVLADSTYGMASNINEKKRLLNSLTSSDQAAEARAGIFNAVTPASGGEGVYNALTGQFIADRTGNQVRPGTGTDQTVYGTGAANNVYEDLNPGGVNLFSRNGGILNYAQNGIEINQEYDLSDEDMNELAPYLKKLGLKLEML